MAPKKKPSPKPNRFISISTLLLKAPAAWSLAVFAGLMVFALVGYSRWYQPYLQERYASIDPEKIRLSEPHPFVHADLVQEVFDKTKLNETTPLDPAATAKLATAFDSHPWIKQVNMVQKEAFGSFFVDVDYRYPVAVFHLTGNPQWIAGVEAYLADLGFPTEGGMDNLFYPIDDEGFLLPTSGMTESDARQMIQIEVRDVFPSGSPGTPFGDHRVEGAATLASLLKVHSSDVKIKRITVDEATRSQSVPQMRLTINDDVEVIWGSPPGKELPSELGLKEKIAALNSGHLKKGDDLRTARHASQAGASPIK